MADTVDAAEAAFFAAQDEGEAGRKGESARLYQVVLAACGAAPPKPIASDAALLAGEGEPSAETRRALLHSLAANALGELAVDAALELGFPTSVLDCAPATAAAAHFEAALASWPANVEALASLALLRRDTRRADAALGLFERAAALPTRAAPAAETAPDWREAWVFAPRRAAVPVAAMTLALLRSQRGEHAAALPLLRRFGFTRRLSPAVWARAAHPPAPPSSPARAPSPPPPDAPRMWADAVPPRLDSALRAALAPDAAYWRQTGYHTAASEKQYFTFFYDVAANAPTNAVEHLIARLRPLLGAEFESRAVCAEWWAHTRLTGRHPGHELHYDLEEGVMEASGRVLHPLVSSVVYLAGDASAGPTIVFDETLGDGAAVGGDAAAGGGAPAARCWLAHPRRGGFLTFPGDRLHGVLPVEATAGAAAAADGTSDDQRLTLLIAWYGTDARAASAKRGRALGPQGRLPRPTRRVTWPRDLDGYDRAAAAADAAAPPPREVPLVAVPHAWEPLPPAAAAAAAAAAKRPPEPLLAVPAHLDQHFFLKGPSDVRDRLWREHGVDGSWAQASRERGGAKKRRR